MRRWRNCEVAAQLPVASLCRKQTSELRSACDGRKDERNLYEPFVGEAKAYHRLLAFARKAGKKTIRRSPSCSAPSLLPRGSTPSVTCVSFFERETPVNQVYYPQFIREAEEEGERAAVLTFSQARDVEERHANLYRRALNAMLSDETHDYCVCQVCGYIAEWDAPDQRPICNAKREHFRQIA